MCDGFIFTEKFCDAVWYIGGGATKLTALLIMLIYAVGFLMIVGVAHLLVEQMDDGKDTVYNADQNKVPGLNTQLRQIKYSHPVGSDFYKAACDNIQTTAMRLEDVPVFKHPRPRVSNFYNWETDGGI